MKRWPTKPLGELAARITKGESPGWQGFQYTDEGPLFVTSENVLWGRLDVSEPKHIPLAFHQKLARSQIQPNDVLLNLVGASIGRCCLAPNDLGAANVNQAVAVISCGDSLLPTFLKYLLLSPGAQSYFHGGKVEAARANISLIDVRQFLTVMPPLAEQERIVKLLDEADELRKLRAQADRRTAALIPALFHKMFGDPTSNPFGWPVECVGNLFNLERGGARCGPFGSALKKHEYVESGIPVWGIPNILPNQFVEEGSLFISPSKFEELRAYSIESGDLLFSRAGTVGRICVARPKAKVSIMGSNLIRLALDPQKMTPDFFSALMTHFGKDVGSLRANSDEGAYSFMNTTVLKGLRIYVPPLAQQKEFAARVTEIRAVQAEQAASRLRLVNLFQSMLHRAFNGEL